MLVDDRLPAGAYEAVWDGTDRNGRSVASGVYLYRLTSAAYIRTRQMMLVR